MTFSFFALQQKPLKSNQRGSKWDKGVEEEAAGKTFQELQG